MTLQDKLQEALSDLWTKDTPFGQQLQGDDVAIKKLTQLFKEEVEHIIGEPLKDDATYTPTLEDPYGRRHLMDTTKTSVPKYNWNHGSVETVKRQLNRLRETINGTELK
jgi:hypothetical protein